MTTPREERQARLAVLPLTASGPRPGLMAGSVQQVRDVWAHRQLLDMLIRRELKARYKDSTLGFLWSLMRPLALLLIYYIALGKFLGAERNIPQFAIFIYTGLTAWNLFAEIVTAGTNSIVVNAGLIKKVYLPREIFPLSGVGAALFNFGVQLVVLLCATAVGGRFPTGSRWLYFPLSLAVILVVGTAWAVFLSAVNVYLRDVQYLVEIGLMIAFWASPIVYSWAQVQGQVDSVALQTAYLANPMTLAVIGFQQTFWVAGGGQAVPPHLTEGLFIWLGLGVLGLWASQRVFVRLQGNFAQEL